MSGRSAHSEPGRPEAPGGRVLVTGAGGLLGTALLPYLAAQGYEVVRLARPRSARHANRTADSPPDTRRATPILSWDPERDDLDPGPLEGLRAVVHLAGESLAAGRWTAAAKDRILRSRSLGTGLLARRLAALVRKPEVLLCASAIGYYGNRGAQTLDETAGPGTGFLAEVVKTWEDAAAPIKASGIRRVHLRMGLVLTPHGGALARMLPAFRLGLGARLGSGRQYWSWIALDDLLDVFSWVLARPSLPGPLNVATPFPVTNAEFTRTLARVLGRCAPFVAPAPLLRIALGEMADDALLASTRVQPAGLVGSGFVFRHPELEPALRSLLGKTLG